MDQEILAVLRDIKFSIYVLIAATGVAIALSLFRIFFSSRSVLKEANDRVFKTSAEELLEKGEINDLVSHCNDKLSKRPNHIYALWYLGKAHFALKDYQAAKTPFEKLAEIQPDWNDELVRPYLDRINAHDEITSNRIY